MSIDTHSAIIGASGSGKTVTAKGQVEEMLGEKRHLAVIDPLGVWWGLRSSRDGDGPGFDIPIFGGDHGDVHILPEHGGTVGAYIAGGMSAIVDLSGMDQRDARVFMLAFLRALRKKPKANFHLIVDEADEFAPQTAPDQAGFELVEQMTWIAKRGRTSGYVLTVITQRPADIAKAVLSQMQTIIAHQLVAPQDQKALDDYLKANGDPVTRKTVMGSLPGLQRGERWVYSPRAGILERGLTALPSTFDSSRTPEPGETIEDPKLLAQIDMGEIRAALAPKVEAILPGAHEAAEAEWTIERAQGQRQLDEMSAEIGRLRADLAYQTERRRHWQLTAHELKSKISSILADVDTSEAPAEAQGGKEPGSSSSNQGASHVDRSARARPVEPEPSLPAQGKGQVQPREAAPVRAAGDGSPSIPPRHKRILDAIAWSMRLTGSDAVERGIIAWQADISPKSSGFQNDLGAMRTAGLIEYPRQGCVSLTQRGGEIATFPPITPTRDDLFNLVCQRLEPRFVRLLRPLYLERSNWTRERLATEAGISASSSGFQNDLGKLRTIGLIDYPGPKLVGLGRVLA